MYPIFAGLLLMGFGFIFEPLWPFIFFGPLVIAPIGALLPGHQRLPGSGSARWVALVCRRPRRDRSVGIHD